MPINIPWPHPEGADAEGMKGRVWRWTSNVTVFAVGSISKLWMQGLNTTFVYNQKTLLDLIEARETGRPLLTVCNHTTTADDPLLFGLLPFRLLARPRLMRWGLGAHNVCFGKESHATFFALGKIFPVVRGDGVYQKGMDALIEKMNAGDWVHVFPEGKVNMTQEWMRVKWGVGRLVAEADIPPLVLPFWHEGVSDVLPVVKPYIPRIRQKVTVVVGEIIDTRELLEKLKRQHTTVEGLRKAVTDYVQGQLKLCRDRARQIHNAGDQPIRSSKPKIHTGSSSNFRDKDSEGL